MTMVVLMDKQVNIKGERVFAIVRAYNERHTDVTVLNLK